MDERVASLNSSLNGLRTLETSDQVYSISKINSGEMGGMTLKDDVINIGYLNTANFVHETTHAGQFERGEIAFLDGKTIGQDIFDEVGAYKAQFAYDPASVSSLKSTSEANSFAAITPIWLRGIQTSDGSYPYSIGGYANTGNVRVDINSTKNTLLQAYPTAAQAFIGLRDNIKLKNIQGIYYKK